MWSVGIDPGVTGGAVAIQTGRGETLMQMNLLPFRNLMKHEDCSANIRRLLTPDGGECSHNIVIEDVGGLPGDTPNTAFVLGETFGAWKALVAFFGTNMRLARPQIWQTRLARQFGERWCPKDRDARKKFIHRCMLLLLKESDCDTRLPLYLADAAALAWLEAKGLLSDQENRT